MTASVFSFQLFLNRAGGWLTPPAFPVFLIDDVCQCRILVNYEMQGPWKILPVNRKSKVVGYARVSMNDQTNQRQIDEMVKFGVHPPDIFTDTASGKNMDRPGWVACWKDLSPGDLLVVHAIDRLGRDMLQVFQTLKALHEKGAALKVLSMDIDTRTPVGYFTFTIMAGFAEMERKLILERTMHGLAKARERGVTGGTRALYTHEEVLEAAERWGVNQAHKHLKKPSVRQLTQGGLKKALARARQWEHEQRMANEQA